MPFAPDDPKDVLARITALKDGPFAARERLLRQCDDAMSIPATEWQRQSKRMVWECDKALLVAQEQAATVRVAVPFEVRLPTFPDQSSLDQKCLENTEAAIAAFWDMAVQDAVARGLRDPRYDMAALAVEQGAICGMAYWRTNREDKPWPRLELYPPRFTYFEADQDGMAILGIAFTLSEAALAGLVESRGWLGAWDRQAQSERQIYQVWLRDGSSILETVVGANGAGVAQALVPVRAHPEFTAIPVRYFPAGGPATRNWTAPVGHDFETLYGHPWKAPMLPIVQSMTYLGRLIVRAGLLAVEPPRGFRPEPDAPPFAPDIGPGEAAVVEGEFIQMPQVNASAIPFLQQQHATLGQMIEQLGLPGPLLTGSPTPRSELLRAGLEQMGQQNLIPFWGCMSAAVLGFSADWRTGQKWLFNHGVQTMTLEVTPAGAVTVNPRRENRDYQVDDFWWDGTFEVLRKPPDPKEEMVRNFQVYQLATSNPANALDPLYLQELLFGIQNPEQMYQRVMQRQTLAAQQPVMTLLALQRDDVRLAKIERLLGTGTVREALDRRLSLKDRLLKRRVDKLSQEDLSWLSEQGRLAGMGVHEVLEWTAREIGDLVAVVRARQKDLRTRLIPESQRPQAGQAPAPAATVAPAMAPSQGSPAGDGFTGGGGLNDQMAAMLGAQGGSDQGLGPRRGGGLPLQGA